MKGKKGYKDKEKQREYVLRQKRGYAIRTGAFLYERRRWTCGEDALVLEHKIPDRKLSEQIHRSVDAIQKRRVYLKKGA